MADFQCRREEREVTEREEETQKQREEDARREEARMVETHTETEAGGEAGTSQSRYKKGHMINIYLTDSDEEALVDFVKDQEELDDKTNEHFKDRKECLWERFANSCKLSVKEFERPCLSDRGHVMAS